MPSKTNKFVIGFPSLLQHRRQAIHRDGKSINIILDGKFIFKLFPFPLLNQFPICQWQSREAKSNDANLVYISSLLVNRKDYHLVEHLPLFGSLFGGTPQWLCSRFDYLLNMFTKLVRHEDILCFLPSHETTSNWISITGFCLLRCHGNGRYGKTSQPEQSKFIQGPLHHTSSSIENVNFWALESAVVRRTLIYLMMLKLSPFITER